MFVEDGEGMAAGEESGEDGLEVHFDTSGKTELARRDYEAHGEMPSPLGEGWGEGLAERFRGSRVGAGAMPTNHEPWGGVGKIKIKNKIKIKRGGEVHGP